MWLLQKIPSQGHLSSAEKGRGKEAGIAKRQLCDQPKQLAPEATREKKIGEQKVRVLKYWNKKEEHTEKSYARRKL